MREVRVSQKCFVYIWYLWSACPEYPRCLSFVISWSQLRKCGRHLSILSCSGRNVLCLWRRILCCDHGRTPPRALLACFYHRTWVSASWCMCVCDACVRIHSWCCTYAQLTACKGEFLGPLNVGGSSSRNIGNTQKIHMQAQVCMYTQCAYIYTHTHIISELQFFFFVIIFSRFSFDRNIVLYMKMFAISCRI